MLALPIFKISHMILPDGADARGHDKWAGILTVTEKAIRAVA
jgi:hypothetical protein